MKQAHAVTYIQPTAEALELEVERAWCALTSYPATLSLTPTGRIVKAGADTCVRTEQIGRYTKAVSLADFRGDVFHIFEAMTRRGPGHG